MPAVVGRARWPGQSLSASHAPGPRLPDISWRLASSKAMTMGDFIEEYIKVLPYSKHLKL
jgi:hypothetical protein